jgi:hypothetical protein
MSWHYSQALVEAYLGENSLDGEPCVQWRLMPTAQDDLCSGKMKDTCHRSPYGMMFVPLMDSLGVELLTLFLAAFRAKGTQPLETCMAAGILMAGLTPFALLNKSSQGQSSWRTCQGSLFHTGEELSQTWPSWGIACDGGCFRVQTPMITRPKSENASSLWRRPAATDWKRRNLDWPSVRKLGNPLCLPQQIAQRGHSGYLNPQFPAWLMGWPTTWAKSAPLETAKFQQWLNSHGRS